MNIKWLPDNDGCKASESLVVFMEQDNDFGRLEISDHFSQICLIQMDQIVIYKNQTFFNIFVVYFTLVESCKQNSQLQ